MSDRHLFKIDDGERHWYSATSQDEATGMHQEHYGYPDEEMDSIDMVEQVPDDEQLTVFVEDTEESKVTKSAREWANDKAGFIASTVW